MHAICPKCNRPLARPNSWHYCEQKTFEDLLRGKPESLKTVFYLLLNEVGSWEGVSASATKNCVVFISAKTFLVVRVLKKELDLRFSLPDPSDDFPIYKVAVYGKKAEHYIRLSDPEDYDNDVRRFLRASYEFVNR